MKRRISLEASVGWELEEEIPSTNSSFKDDKGPIFAPGGIIPVFVTNSDALSYLDSTNGQIEAIGRDITTNSALFPANFIANWNDFSKEWKTFYDKEKDDTHYLDAVACMNQTDLYVERAKQYQLQAKSLASPGYSPVAPGVTTDPNSVVNPENNPQTLMKTAIIGAGVVLGGLIMLKLLDYVPKPASELRKKYEEKEELIGPEYD